MERGTWIAAPTTKPDCSLFYARQSSCRLRNVTWSSSRSTPPTRPVELHMIHKTVRNNLSPHKLVVIWQKRFRLWKLKDEMEKATLLSHSSRGNLSKHINDLRSVRPNVKILLCVLSSVAFHLRKQRLVLFQLNESFAQVVTVSDANDETLIVLR